MHSLVTALFGGLLDKTLIKYTTQSGSKWGIGLVYDEVLAHEKRTQATELVQKIKEINSATLTDQCLKSKEQQDLNWFTLYKNLVLQLVTANEEKVSNICREKNATLGNYSHFLEVLRDLLTNFIQIAQNYNLKNNELFSDLKTDMRLYLFKTFMEYELEKILEAKLNEKGIYENLKQKLFNHEKHETKVTAIRSIAKRLNESLTNVEKTDKKYNNIVLTHTESAIMQEQKIQVGVLGASVTGNYLKKITDYTLGTMSFLTQKTFDAVRTTKLGEKLKIFHEHLLTVIDEKSHNSHLH